MKDKIIDAVTLVLTCGGQLYMVKRSESMRHFPGYYAFFGGKVDQKSESLVNALQREFEEEAGRPLRPEELKRLHFVGHSQAPFNYPYRFRTHYYHLELEHLEDFFGPSKEFEFGLWRSFDEWLTEYQAGRLLVVPPVLKVLESLTHSRDLSHWHPTTFSQPPVGVEFLSDLFQFFVRSYTIPPSTDTNCFVINFSDRPPLAIDPAPESQELRSQLVERLKSLQVEDFLITHHHTDHWDAQGNLFEHFAGKIYVSKATKEIFQNRYGNYWSGPLKDRLLEVGSEDVLGLWKDQEVRVLPVPGHASGHLALYVQGGQWAIVGDLLQGTDSVVVGGEFGDMDDYIQSLEKVIALNPSVIFPSHGLPLGGVYFLQKLLKHRLHREMEIASLLKQGRSVEEITHILYPGTSEIHAKLARANVEAHIQRIKKLS